jgi:hypothetical protein
VSAGLRWALLRVLAALGVLHVITAVVTVWLWRHRGSVVRALAQAVADEARRPRR